MNKIEDAGSPFEPSPTETSHEQNSRQTVRPTRIRGFWWAGGLILLTFAAQWLGYRTDQQMANLASAGLLIAAFITFSVAWFRHFRSRRWLRYAPLLTLGTAAALGFLLFRPIGVSGELVPQFAYRFGSDQPLPRPANGPADEPLELAVEAGDFPGMLGPQRDGRLPHRRFATDWSQRPPELRWRQPIGAGWSGFAVVGTADAAAGRGPYGFTLEQRGDEEWVSCYDLADGRVVWHHAEPGEHFHPLGGLGPRSTPTVSPEGRVYAQGATGVVWCLDGRSGELLWRADLLEIAGIDQGTSEAAVTWGRAGSPLLVDDLVILPLGGAADQPAGVRSLIALDALTGSLRWTGGDHQISYASPVLATLGGVRQILSVNEDFVAGYAPRDGRVLWTHPWPSASNAGASCSNPAPVGDDRLLLSKGYGGGAELLRLSPSSASAEALRVASLWSNSRVLKTKFTNVCIDGDYAYGLSDGSLECVRLADGERQWKQPRRGRYGHGHALIVGDVLVVSSEAGELATVALDPTAYRELGRFQAIEGKTWNPPAVVGNLLVIRNAEEAAVWEAIPRDEAQNSVANEVMATGSRVAYGSP